MYKRSGTLFESRFKSIAVDKESYLIYLCRYIHRNPYEANLVTDIANWPYSNYLEWICARNGKLVDKEFISSYFKSASDYRQFVMDIDGKQSPNDLGVYFFDE